MAFTCPHCSINTATNYTLERHIQRHHTSPHSIENEEFVCKQCLRPFQSEFWLKKHVETTHFDVYDPELHRSKAVENENDESDGEYEDNDFYEDEVESEGEASDKDSCESEDSNSDGESDEEAEDSDTGSSDDEDDKYTLNEVRAIVRFLRKRV